VSIPITKVFIAFDLSASGQEFFTLDDPIKGLLNNTIYTLPGETFVEVPFVKSVSVTRGKSRELEGFQAGQATVVFDNRARSYDPFYSGSLYPTQIVPKKKIKITTDDNIVFVGIIDDWNYSYDVSGQSDAVVTCSDGFSYFANLFLEEYTNSVQLSSERLNTVLSKSEVNYPTADRLIDVGAESLQADLVPQGTNVLSYMQLISQSENANLYMSNENTLVFDNANLFLYPNQIVKITDDESVDSIPYQEIEVIYGTENLYNRISISNANGKVQVSEDITSQNAYGISTFSQDNLLLADDLDANRLANKILQYNKDPELRINSVSVLLNDLSETQQNALTSLELTNTVRVVFTPNQVGSPIDRFLEVIGIDHQIEVDTHRIKLTFKSIIDNPFILNDTTYGRLAIYAPASYDDSGYTYDSSSAVYDSAVTYGYKLGY
jgi:hypothetical protein